MKAQRILLIVLVVILFVFFMVSFSFPDLFALFYVPNMLFKGNIYSQVIAQKNICVWLDATYPPLYYLTMGVYLKIIQFLRLLPSYLFSLNECPVFDLILDMRFLFWVKLPHLVLHGLSALVFSKFFSKDRFEWFLLWFLNPIVIFISFMFGQYEIIAAFFILLSLYFAKEKRMYLTFLALGIGAAYKNFPFLLIFPFLFYFTKGIKEKLFSIFLTVLPYLLSLSFFFNKDYLKFAGFSENTKMLGLGFYLGETKISVYVILFFILVFISFSEKIKDFNFLIKYCFAFGSIYFLTSAWSPQRFLFLAPPLLLVASQSASIFRLLPVLNIVYFAYVSVVHLPFFDHTLLRPIIKTMMAYPYDVSLFVLPKTIIFSSMLAILICFGIFSLREKFQPVVIKNRDIVLNLLGLLAYLILIVYLLFASRSLVW